MTIANIRLKIMDNISKYWLIFYNIGIYLTFLRATLIIFEEKLAISNNIRPFRPTLARPHCFETFLGSLT